MFKYVPIKKQLRQVEKENIILKDNIEKNQADIAYVAMMADIDIMDDMEDNEIEN